MFLRNLFIKASNFCYQNTSFNKNTLNKYPSKVSVLFYQIFILTGVDLVVQFEQGQGTYQNSPLPARLNQK